jgi:hypothetical protein
MTPEGKTLPNMLFATGCASASLAGEFVFGIRTRLAM